MTRKEYMKVLSESAARNRAVKKHLEKVRTMSEGQFQAHYAALQARQNSPEVQATAARMAGMMVQS